MHPEIDFRHVLRELSVNQQDPCEIIRELVSNSYDASASKMWYIPLPQYGGFIFCDNGIGLDGKNKVREITPFQAFFSIGRSTKTEGKAVGYKCQGSKLCFASTRVAILTRSASDRRGTWRWKQIENPKSTLSLTTDLKPDQVKSPSSVLCDFFIDPDERTESALAHLNERFFDDLTTGTMIIVLGLDTHSFQSHFLFGDKPSSSYLFNYIRTATKHADIRRIYPAQGFKPAAIDTFARQLRDEQQHDVVFSVWTGTEFLEIPQGYWHLPMEENVEVSPPLRVSRLRDARFAMRAARSFHYEGRTYSLVLTVDGNRRALEAYESLDRRGKRVSGIRLTDQRGTYICAQGVKVAPFTLLFQNRSRHIHQRFECLAHPDAQAHYALFINGPFHLVTNRNAITQAAIETLQSDEFSRKVADFLENTYKNDQVFRDFIDRLNRERIDTRLDAQVSALRQTKSSIDSRRRFRLSDIPLLKSKIFVEPMDAEEHWVGALYTLLSHFVPPRCPHLDLWMRPLTFSARGLDSVAQRPGVSTLKSDELVSVEYKYIFSTRETYNHPLILTDYIVAWDIEIGSPDEDDELRIDDDYDYFGYVREPSKVDKNCLSFVVDRLEALDGQTHPGRVTVISLSKLIQETFGVSYRQPPQKRAARAKQVKRRSGRS